MIKESFKYTVESMDLNKRLDKFLVEHLEQYTRSAVQQSIKDQQILINNTFTKANYKLRLGDVISGYVPQVEEISVLPEDIPLNIIYEDQDIMIINKEAGMVVHPAPGHYSGTLVNALLYYTKGNLSSLNDETRPGIVHRIDKDTSGLMVVAKNNISHENLAAMFHDYEVTRKYHALVFGNLKEEEGIIDARIGRHPIDRKKMAVTEENARHALSFYKVIKQFKGFTYVEVTLHTGRTHQIRVHMNHIGHPIVGDLVYGPKKQPYRRTGQLLHAKFLGFYHPITNEYMEFETQLPSYFQKVIDNIR